ncbi:MAG: hypothetical protein AAFZ01_10075 [Pseudomonadota bacterium]
MVYRPLQFTLNTHCHEMLKTYDRDSGIHAKHLKSYCKAAELQTRLRASLKGAASPAATVEAAPTVSAIAPLEAAKLEHIIDIARYRRQRHATGIATRRIVRSEADAIAATG